MIAVDDRSEDDSRAIVESQPLLLDLLVGTSGPDEPVHDGDLHRLLTEAAWGYEPDWLLGIDADERVERDFRRRAEVELDRAEEEEAEAMWVPWIELWDGPGQARVDGIWGEKRKACLFAANRGHRFDERPLHGTWAPVLPPYGDYPRADLRLYHLRMIRAEDRAARAARYRQLDPDNEYQAIGYDYLVDEAGIELAPLEHGRGYEPLGE